METQVKGSERPSRLKGIETGTFHSFFVSFSFRCSERPSRLKGIETFLVPGTTGLLSVRKDLPV